MEEDFFGNDSEGEKIVFALLSLTLERRAGEAPGSESSWDLTGLPLVTSLYDLRPNDEASREELGRGILIHRSPSLLSRGEEGGRGL